MAGVGHKSVRFLLQSASSPLLKCNIILNAIRPQAIQLPRFCSIPRDIVPCPSNGRVRSYSTMQPDNPTPATAPNEINRSDIGSRMASESGRQYSIESVLQEKEQIPEKVYLASYVIEYSISPPSLVIQKAHFFLKHSRNDGHKFVFKELPLSFFS